jgi:entry exclusion lipoprotein TrbK
MYQARVENGSLVLGGLLPPQVILSAIARDDLGRHHPGAQTQQEPQSVGLDIFNVTVTQDLTTRRTNRLRRITMKKLAVSTPRIKILFIALLSPLVFSLTGCGKSTVMPEINRENCYENPKLLDSLEEKTRDEFEHRCMYTALDKASQPRPISIK